MTNRNKPFPSFFYVVKSREVRDDEGSLYTEWVIRQGGSTHTIEKYDSKQEAVDRASDVAENREKAGVVVTTMDGSYQKMIPNQNSALYKQTLRESTITGE